MVKAYKNLLKEKEALEASVKVLTSAVPTQPSKPAEFLAASDIGDKRDVESHDIGELETIEKDTSDGHASVSLRRQFSIPTPCLFFLFLRLNLQFSSLLLQNTEDDTSEIQRLKEQLATLTNSLSTVTQQKSTMEASYQAEKKKLRVSDM